MRITTGMPASLRWTALALLLGVTPAHAVLTFSDSNGNTIGAPSLFDGVGILNTGSVFCSAALLGDGVHVLTAAHCVSGSQASNLSLQFQLSGGPVTYGVSSFAINPSYVLNGLGFPRGGDLAVLTLNAPADASLHRYGLYTGSGEFGTTVTIAGYGYAGSGTSGDAGGLGLLRTGSNVYDVDPFFLIGSSLVDFGAFLLYDFDNGTATQSVTGNQGLGSAEGFIGAGDSGGPSFISSSGNLYIAGVHSWRARLIDGNGNSTDINSQVDGTFGEVGADTRVSTYAAWINNTAASVPEPGTTVLVSLALAGILASARRRKVS